MRIVNQSYLSFSLAIIALLQFGCGIMPTGDSVCYEPKFVHSVRDEGKYVTIPDGMIFANNSRTKGVRFPEGKYELEAEDDDYWYFRSEKPLEFRVLRNGMAVDGRDIPGGLMVTKHTFSSLQGAAYIDGDIPNQRIMMQRMGREFLLAKGSSWILSFDGR
jgi:hypothetical protein